MTAPDCKPGLFFCNEGRPQNLSSFYRLSVQRGRFVLLFSFLCFCRWSCLEVIIKLTLMRRWSQLKGKSLNPDCVQQIIVWYFIWITYFYFICFYFYVQAVLGSLVFDNCLKLQKKGTQSVFRLFLKGFLFMVTLIFPTQFSYSMYVQYPQHYKAHLLWAWHANKPSESTKNQRLLKLSCNIYFFIISFLYTDFIAPCSKHTTHQHFILQNIKSFWQLWQDYIRWTVRLSALFSLQSATQQTWY